LKNCQLDSIFLNATKKRIINNEALICFLPSHLLFNPTLPQFGSQDSGGPLTPEWAAYDVKFYNINLNINPDKQTINGWVGVTAEAIADMKEFVLDLDIDTGLQKLLGILQLNTKNFLSNMKMEK
jgi:hypothetical protein